MEVIINLKQFIVVLCYKQFKSAKRLMEVVKRKRRCQAECKEHIFNMQSLKANSSKYDIKLLFCPKFQRQPLPPQHTFPQYNNDYKFYTSAFILGVDRRILLKNDQQQLMDHQKQIRDQLEKHNQLVFPRPNSKHSLCSVCKEHYKNYYLHISSEEHKERISLSNYNYHIKDLCNRYIDQWDGAEERADEEAERRAVEEQERCHKVVSMTIQENDDDLGSLLDVQRGDNDDYNEDIDDDYADREYGAKPSKKVKKSIYKDDDTIMPLTYRSSHKKNSQEKRGYPSQYIKKKASGYISTNRGQRQRQERRYQRERDKLRSQKDNNQNTKEFTKANQKDGDTFIILKAPATQPSIYNNNQYSNDQFRDDYLISRQKDIYEKPQQNNQKQASNSKQPKEFIWKRTTDRFFKQLEKTNETKASSKNDQFLDKFQKQNKKYEIQYISNEKLKRSDDKQTEKSDYRPFSYYPYPPPMPYMMPPYNSDRKGPDYGANEYYKHPQTLKNGEQPKYPYDEKGKNMQYYYNPYMYPPPPMYDPYIRPPKPTENEKEKGRYGEPPYEYSPYHWPYSHPYYMPSPPMDPTQPQAPLSDINNPSKVPPTPPMLNNPINPTNPNKNFAMNGYPSYPPAQNASPYPPANPPARYPAPQTHGMPPSYMNYQYPPPHPHQKGSKPQDPEYQHYPNHQGGPYPNGIYGSQPYSNPQAHHGQHQKQQPYQPMNHYYPPPYQYPSQHLPQMQNHLPQANLQK